MAGDFAESGWALNREGLAVLIRLTREVAAAVARGDLDEALVLLEKRRRALAGVSWPQEAEPDFWAEVNLLRGLEEELTGFCRTWREVVAERLTALHHAQLLRSSYAPLEEERRIIDVNK